jgi:hypothetical protein
VPIKFFVNLLRGDLVLPSPCRTSIRTYCHGQMVKQIGTSRVISALFCWVSGSLRQIKSHKTRSGTCCNLWRLNQSNSSSIFLEAIWFSHHLAEPRFGLTVTDKKMSIGTSRVISALFCWVSGSLRQIKSHKTRSGTVSANRSPSKTGRL